MHPVFSKLLLNSSGAGALFAVLIVGVLPEQARSQLLSDQRVPIPYVQPPKGAKSMLVDRIEGQVVLMPTPNRWVGVEEGLEFALFDERHTLISTDVPGESGTFKIKDVTPGVYTLVAAGATFHVLSIPLKVDAIAAHNGPALQLTMRLITDKRKSFVTPITDKALRAELLERVQKDQDIRNEWIKEGVDHPNKEITRRMNAIDAENLAWIREIVHQYGWPGPTLVGRDGVEAAFLLVQHSPHAFQKEMLPLLRSAYRSNNLPGQSYALLLDRVLVGEGKPQVYGTQTRPFAEWHNEEPAFFPIIDEKNVDKRREQIGLFPLSKYIELLRETYFPPKKEKLLLNGTGEGPEIKAKLFAFSNK